MTHWTLNLLPPLLSTCKSRAGCCGPLFNLMTVQANRSQKDDDNNNVHTSSSFVSSFLPLFIGKPLPKSFECMSAPYSTTTSSSILLTNLQNSRSTSSVGTIYTDKHKGQRLVPRYQRRAPWWRADVLCGCAYVDRHVEVIRFESICHFPKTLQSVLSCRLFKAKRFGRFLAVLEELEIEIKISLLS